MKNIFLKSAMAVLAAFAISGCSDYLDRTPLDSNSDATNWSSEASIQQFSWKFYSYLSSFSYGSGWTRGQYHGEALTDDYSTESFSEFTKTVPNSSSAWNTPYDVIREANIMLARIDKVPGLSEAAANHWKGVARFFRALYHFQLVQTYGDVVWVGEEIDYAKEENVTKARDSRVLVMDNVVADLQFAADNCYTPANAGVNTINCYVAAALLSRVALYEGAWEKYHNVAGGHADQFYTAAKNAANKVIESGLYQVSDNYKGIYTARSLAGNSEVLLYKVYSLANVNGGKVTVGHTQYGYVVSSTPTWGLTKSAIENYAMADGLPVHMSSSYSDKTMDGMFTNRDKRLSATVSTEVLPVSKMEYSFRLINSTISTTGFWTNKYLNMSWLDQDDKGNYVDGSISQVWNGPNNDTDGPIFQYSEVLENYAEACAELGSCSQADLDKSVNLLRQKHGGIPVLTVSGTNVSVNGTAITKDPKDPAANVLIQELRRDRRSELMTDGFRHADLMRWALGANLDTKKNPDGYVGASQAAIEDYYKKSGSTAAWADVLAKNFFTKDGYKSPYNTSAVGAEGAQVDRVWDDKYYLEPVPAGQILLDPQLGQNDGWK